MAKARKPKARVEPIGPHQRVLQLQRLAGNAVVANLLALNRVVPCDARRPLAPAGAHRVRAKMVQRDPAPPKPSGLWNWMKGRTSNWLQAFALAVGVGSAGGAEGSTHSKPQQPVKLNIADIRKSKEIEEAERGSRSSKKGGKGRLNVRFGLGSILNFLGGLSSDYNTYRRAREGGKTFGEQLREDVGDSDYVQPFFSPLPFPTPDWMKMY